MIIYRTSDRIPVKIGDVLTVWLSPLTVEQRARMFSTAVKMQAGAEQEDAIKAAAMSIKYSVKGIEGDLKNIDGSDYQLEFDPDGSLTDECAEELLQLDGSDKLVRICGHFLKAISDPGIEGVVVDFKGVKTAKKKESSVPSAQ